MPRITLLRVVNAVLLAGILVAATTEVAAQQQQPTGSTGESSTGELVTTFCKLGQQTKCGEEPARVICTYVFSGEFGRMSGNVGFNFGGIKCETYGTITHYKDYKQGQASGLCVTVPRTEADATRTGRDGDDDATC